jgi:hypothetical protein
MKKMIALALMACATPSNAAAKASVPDASLRAELEPLRFLVGHCWSGRFKDGAVDRHCFESAYGGNHVRDRHEVKGPGAPYSGETLYSWNAETKQVEYTYWNSEGGVSRGTMAAEPGGLDFGDQVYAGADGRRMTISTRWRRVGADAYEAVSTAGADPTGSRIVRYSRVD